MALLQIGNGGAVNQAPGDFTLRTNGLTVDPAGKLDISNGAAIVDYTGTSPLPAIQADVIQGYNGGNWLGNGVTSSAAAAVSSSRGVGYGEATDLFGAFPATFAGQQVDATALLVRYTRYGDANLDRTVNLNDFNRLAAGFGSGVRWSQGNYNYDAVVNLTDFNLLAANFGQAAAALEDLLQ
jgi:hypothetical protein